MSDIANRFSPFVLSIVRIMSALLLLQHGLSKFFGFPMPMRPPPMYSLYWYAGIIEIVGGALLLVGLLTRPVAFILAGHLAFVYFLGHHSPERFYPILNGGEPAVLFCFIFLYFAFAGGGPLSVDGMLGRKA